MPETPTRILVTGATGFLGGAVARGLAGSGFEVVATGRNRQVGVALAGPRLSFFPCDLAQEPEAVARLSSGCDAVIHAAALSAPWGDPREFHRANVMATRHVLAAAAGAGVRRFVQISSPSVLFEFRPQPALKEESPWSAPPANHYIATKREAETMVRASGLDWIILRPKALFGPGDQTLLPRLARVAARGRFPLFGPDTLLDLTWIEDAVEAVRLALLAGPELRGRVYHLTSGDPQPRDLALLTLLEVCGYAVSFPRLPIGPLLALAGVLEAGSCLLTAGRWEPPLTRYSVGALAYGQTLDLSAARRDLGYAPKTAVLDRLRETGLWWQSRRAASEARS